MSIGSSHPPEQKTDEEFAFLYANMASDIVYYITSICQHLELKYQELDKVNVPTEAPNKTNIFVSTFSRSRRNRSRRTRQMTQQSPRTCPDPQPQPRR